MMWVTTRGVFSFHKHYGMNWKNHIHVSLYLVVKNRKRHLQELFYPFNFLISCLSISQIRKWNSWNENLGKKLNMSPKSWNIDKINLIFFQNFINKSLVLILKYIVYEFYGCTTIWKWRQFGIYKKKNTFFFCIFQKKL